MSNVPHPALPLLTFSCPSRRTQSSKGQAYHLQLGTWISQSFEHRGLDLPWAFFNGDFVGSEVLISFFSASPLARSKIICPAAPAPSMQRVSSSLPGVLEPGRRPSEGPKTSGQGEGPRCGVGKAKVLHRRRGNGGPGLWSLDETSFFSSTKGIWWGCDGKCWYNYGKYMAIIGIWGVAHKPTINQL
jgi:hypothetical protein